MDEDVMGLLALHRLARRLSGDGLKSELVLHLQRQDAAPLRRNVIEAAGEFEEQRPRPLRGRSVAVSAPILTRPTDMPPSMPTATRQATNRSTRPAMIAKRSAR